MLLGNRVDRRTTMGEECGREELAQNAHRFTVIDGELLCSACRDSLRGIH